ncbi:MAG TPA: hypothetical protein VFU21_33050 [Kofleriaceae bacterium]|nr:hypothetical protein [Kofleriaceae bacterium]
MPSRAPFAALLVIATTSPALAQVDTAPSVGRVAGESISVSSVRSYAEDWLVNPRRELELGGSFRFVTAPESNLTADDGGELRFSDVGIFHAGGRLSFARRFEVAAGIDLLAKQPGYLDEPAFNGGDLGVRFSLGKKWALWARGAGGPLLDDAGGWGDAAGGLQARTSIDETIRFQAAAGVSGTRLFMGEDSGRPWFTELVSHGEALLRTPRGEVAGWLGIDYRVPLAHSDGNLEIDPQTRLNFQLGFMLGYVGKWDLYAVYAVIDRGDVEDPATTLPVLDGGFDQSQLILGGSRRFDLEPKPDDQALQMVGGR